MNTDKLNQCALQVAIPQMLSALQNLERTGLNQKLGGDSAAYSRLVNALSRSVSRSHQRPKIP
jgi:hypothetical protein